MNLYLNLDLLFNIYKYMFEFEWYNETLLYCKYSNKGIQFFCFDFQTYIFDDFGHYKSYGFPDKLRHKNDFLFYQTHEYTKFAKKQIAAKNKNIILDIYTMQFLTSKKDNISNIKFHLENNKV